MFEALSRLAPVLLRHLFSYGELLREESRDAWRQLQRRALGLAVATASGFIALLTGCLWLIAATWDGPNRLKAVAALCLGFTLVALIGLWYASTGLHPGQPRPFQRLRSEWEADLERIAGLGLGRGPQAEPEPEPDPESGHQDREHQDRGDA